MQYVNSLWWVWKFFYCRRCWYWHIHLAVAAMAAAAADNTNILMCAWNNSKRTLNSYWKVCGIESSLVNVGILQLKSTYQNAWAIDAFYASSYLSDHKSHFISFQMEILTRIMTLMWEFLDSKLMPQKSRQKFHVRLSAVVLRMILTTIYASETCRFGQWMWCRPIVNLNDRKNRT